jgi:hypothetical protein
VRSARVASALTSCCGPAGDLEHLEAFARRPAGYLLQRATWKWRREESEPHPTPFESVGDIVVVATVVDATASATLEVSSAVLPGHDQQHDRGDRRDDEDGGVRDERKTDRARRQPVALGS